MEGEFGIATKTLYKACTEAGLDDGNFARLLTHSFIEVICASKGGTLLGIIERCEYYGYDIAKCKQACDASIEDDDD